MKKPLSLSKIIAELIVETNLACKSLQPYLPFSPKPIPLIIPVKPFYKRASG